MHPTMERMFMFSTLTGKTTDMNWPDDSSDASIRWVSKYGDECSGHRGYDVFPFGFLDTDIDGFEVRTGSNFFCPPKCVVFALLLLVF